jgi:hypothetical protein
MKQFKIRASQASKLMGRIGLTDIQEAKLIELTDRNNGIGKPLTDKMKIELSGLEKIKSNPELPETAISYLKEWYSESRTGVNKEINNKQINKGNYCENEAISVIAERLDFGFLKKNTKFFEDNFFCGTPDILKENTVIDAKCSWDYVTFLDSVTSDINYSYWCQLQVYMHLTGKKNASLCYVLLNTPSEVNYGNEVIWSHIPINERFYSIHFEYDSSFITELEKRVIMARKWLTEYDQLVKSKLGINESNS